MCSQDSPEPPQFIFWFHNDEEISYDSPRGGVSQITEKGRHGECKSHLQVFFYTPLAVELYTDFDIKDGGG